MVKVMKADQLQRVFRTFSDPTRVRILALLEREELAVQEIMTVLGMAQSRVSRHLAILREAGLLEDRRDGTFVFYRFVPPQEAPWRDTWALVVKNLRGDATVRTGDDQCLHRAGVCQTSLIRATTSLNCSAITLGGYRQSRRKAENSMSSEAGVVGVH